MYYYLASFPLSPSNDRDILINANQRTHADGSVTLVAEVSLGNNVFATWEYGRKLLDLPFTIQILVSRISCLNSVGHQHT